MKLIVHQAGQQQVVPITDAGGTSQFRKAVNELFASAKIIGKHGKASIREQPSPAGGKEYFADFPDGRVEGPFMSVAQLKARVEDATPLSDEYILGMFANNVKEQIARNLRAEGKQASRPAIVAELKKRIHPDILAGHGKVREDSYDSLRLCGSVDSGDIVAKIYFDSEWEEYGVKLFIAGAHQANADYHTDDRDDAYRTASAMVHTAAMKERA